MAEELRKAPPDGRNVEEMLGEIMARLDRIEGSLEVLEEARTEGPALAATVMDTFDDYARRAQNRGIDFDERGRRIAKLLERVTEPKFLDAVEYMVEAVEESPGLFAMVVDIFDEQVGRAAARGADITQMTRSAVEGAVKLGEFVLSDEFKTLLDSGMLDPGAIRVIGRAGRALADVSEDDVGTPGLLGLFSRSRKTNVRRSLNFGLRFSNRFGELLESGDPKRIES